ncbi:hypothetical protein RUM44_007914 [Polyplax serrata]|uniref:Uncharacterized protein n=1 Tax=Polyplax serrata TaxID=468196 RepID=A0ABR1B8N9_POLSC
MDRSRCDDYKSQVLVFPPAIRTILPRWDHGDVSDQIVPLNRRQERYLPELARLGALGDGGVEKRKDEKEEEWNPE